LGISCFSTYLWAKAGKAKVGLILHLSLGNPLLWVCFNAIRAYVVRKSKQNINLLIKIHQERTYLLVQGVAHTDFCIYDPWLGRRWRLPIHRWAGKARDCKAEAILHLSLGVCFTRIRAYGHWKSGQNTNSLV
jgi:hypothetical protein